MFGIQRLSCLWYMKHYVYQSGQSQCPKLLWRWPRVSLGSVQSELAGLGSYGIQWRWCGFKTCSTVSQQPCIYGKHRTMVTRVFLQIFLGWTNFSECYIYGCDIGMTRISKFLLEKIENLIQNNMYLMKFLQIQS